MAKTVHIKDTLIEKIENNEAQDFLITNHNQGAVKGTFSKTSVGMFYKNELIGVIQLCSPRTIAMKKKYSTEILRMGFKRDFKVIDGTKALVQHCIEKYNPADLFAYQENLDERGAGELGFSLAVQEGTADNKIYEWFNPNKSFYTYKITATDSNKYYYGVRSIKIPFHQLTEEKCLKDAYYGSGQKEAKNNKFVNWKKKHKTTLKKEIIQVFKTKATAYLSEKELINNLWQTDKLCLNSAPGGLYAGFVKGWNEGVAIKLCSIHGETKHRGNACYKCFMNKLVTEKECEIHGLTKFQGDSCSKCAVRKTFVKKDCPVHGLTTFSGKHCRKCSVAKTVHMKECSIHGLTKHQGNICNSCNALSSISFKNCPVHGETKFTGDKCRKCISAGNNAMKHCEIHGMVNYRGKSCMKCSAQKRKHTNGLHIEAVDNMCYLCYVNDNQKVDESL